MMKDPGAKWTGKIPAHWKLLRFKYLAKICNGMDKSEVETVNGEFPIYGSGGLFSQANKYLYSGESVLLGRKGTIDRPLYVSGKFWTVDTMYYTEINCSLVLPKFFYFLCTTIDFEFYKSGSVLPSMTKEDLGEIKFKIPTIKTQKEIVAYLDQKCLIIDKLITQTNMIIGRLTEYRSSLISAVVTGQFPIPEES